MLDGPVIQPAGKSLSFLDIVLTCGVAAAIALLGFFSLYVAAELNPEGPENSPSVQIAVFLLLEPVAIFGAVFGVLIYRRGLFLGGSRRAADRRQMGAARHSRGVRLPFRRGSDLPDHRTVLRHADDGPIHVGAGSRRDYLAARRGFDCNNRNPGADRGGTAFSRRALHLAAATSVDSSLRSHQRGALRFGPRQPANGGSDLYRWNRVWR